MRSSVSSNFDRIQTETISRTQKSGYLEIKNLSEANKKRHPVSLLEFHKLTFIVRWGIAGMTASSLCSKAFGPLALGLKLRSH